MKSERKHYDCLCAHKSLKYTESVTGWVRRFMQLNCALRFATGWVIYNSAVQLTPLTQHTTLSAAPLPVQPQQSFLFEE